MNSTQLQRSAEKFNSDPFREDRRAEALSQIEAFQSTWPKQRIEELTKEQYALGAQSESFSWWVEFGTKKVANMGGYASKHRLYMDKSGKYVFPQAYKDADECFADIKKNLLALYELIETWQISDFDRIDLPHNMKMKIAFLLRPDNLIALLESERLKNVAEWLSIKQGNTLELNAAIRSRIQEVPAAETWDGIQATRFAWKMLVSPGIATTQHPSKQVILYGPPGTGKTFCTKKMALSIIEGDPYE